MKRQQLIWTSFAFVIVGVSITVWKNKRAAQTEQHAAEGALRARKHPPSHPVVEGAAAGPLVRQLQKEWISLRDERGKNFNIITDEHHVLARKTAETLSCSEETLRLLVWLDRQGMGPAARLVAEAVSELFRGNGAEKARRDLVALQNSNSFADLIQETKTPIRTYIGGWSYAAGQSCPPYTARTFIEALHDKPLRQDAQLGFLVNSRQDDSLTVLPEVFQILQGPVRSSMEGKAVQEMLSGLPDDFDFEKAAGLLPAPRGTDSQLAWPRQFARDQFLRRWTKVDPDEAANYIMTSDRMGPEAIAIVAETMVMANPHSAVEWAQDLPVGPYYDAAVAALIPHIDQAYTDEAKELAGRIEDPALRRESEERIARTTVQKGRRSTQRDSP